MAKANAMLIVALALVLAAALVQGCKKKESKKDEWSTGKYVPPAKTGPKLKPLAKFSCKVVGKLRQWRYNPVVAVLPGDRVLVAGGRQSKKWLTSAEIFDPATGKTDSTGAMKHERAVMGTLKLADGRVLVFGGGAKPIELFDPAKGTWRAAGRLKDEAVGVAGVQLASGKVYIAGGELTDRRAMSKQAVLWDPKSVTAKTLPELKLGLRASAFSTKEGKVALLGKDVDEDRSKLYVTDLQSGTIDELKPEGILLKAVKELGRSRGGDQVALAYGPDGKLIDPPTGLRGKALLRFFPSRLSWRSLAKLNHDHGAGGAVVALSPDKIVVLGGSNEVDSAVEVCTPE